MTKKYLLLHNFEMANDKKKAKDFLKIMPQAKIMNYGIIGLKGNREKDEKWISLWVEEDMFMAAWTYFNHSALKRGDYTFEDGLEYMQKHQNDPELCLIISE